MDMQPAVYILASERIGTLYVGVSSDLIKRVWQHKNHHADGFTTRYNIHLLVYFELHADMLTYPRKTDKKMEPCVEDSVD